MYGDNNGTRNVWIMEHSNRRKEYYHVCNLPYPFLLERVATKYLYTYINMNKERTDNPD